VPRRTYLGEQSCETAAAGSYNSRSGEEAGAGILQRAQGTESFEDGNRARAQILGARLVPGKGGSIHDHYPEAGVSQEGSGGAARRSGTNDQGVGRDIHV
jgi:hypothetical protein